MFQFCKKSNRYIIFLLIGLVLNILYEFIVYKINISEGIYRLLVFRYIYLLFLGCFLSENKKLNVTTCIGSILLGIIIISLIDYMNFKIPFFKYWIDTSFLCSLYICPIVYFVINMKINNTIIEYFGRMSYNIFLVQMLYYYSLGKIISRYINNLILEIPISLVICILTGFIFYIYEQKITKKIIEFIK